MGKVCRICLDEKDISQFAKAKRSKDGHLSDCKLCHSVAARARWAKNEGLRNRAHEYERLRRIAIRMDVMSHYSQGTPRCACCGIADYEFLSIDHINGGGRKHQGEMGGNKAMYRWLQLNNYPPGFQVLCMNCNMAKHHYGECPHAQERRENNGEILKERPSDGQIL